MRRTVVMLSLLMALGSAGCAGAGPSPVADAAGTLAAVPAGYAGRTDPLGAQGAAAGAQTFQANCVACHGLQGHGDGPAGAALQPPPRNLAALEKRAADDYLFWRISTGRPGTAMPAWQGVLSEEQIWQLVSFIRTLQ